MLLIPALTRLFDADNSVRDITPRYAKTFNISTVKARVPSKKGSEDWFAGLIKPLARTFLLVSVLVFL